MAEEDVKVLFGRRVRQLRKAKGVSQEAFAHDGPALVEAAVDPNEPPLPPKATLKQGRNMLSALLHGTPHSKEIAERLGAGLVRQLV